MAIRRLRLENERLQAEVTRLRRLVVSGASSVLAEKKTPTENDSDPNSKTHALELELQLAKEALTSRFKFVLLLLKFNFIINFFSNQL